MFLLLLSEHPLAFYTHRTHMKTRVSPLTLYADTFEYEQCGRHEKKDVINIL